MISIEQWRVVIGGFFARRKKAKSRHFIVIGGKPTSIGLKVLLFMSICLVLGGDIETNPGPENDEIMAELREFRLANEGLLNDLKGQMTAPRNDVTKIRSDLDSVNKRVDQVNTYIDTMFLLVLTCPRHQGTRSQDKPIFAPLSSAGTISKLTD